MKSLGVQHGILYPNYFSYERTAEDVTLGTPIADTTAMYGDDGVRLLEDTFRYPKGRVVSTGSPRYDALAAEIRTVNRDERTARPRRLGARETGRSRQSVHGHPRHPQGVRTRVRRACWPRLRESKARVSS